MKSDIESLIQQFNQYDHAIYFATPDQQHQFFGFGKASALQSSSIEEIKNWQAQQTTPVFGGLPFDKQHLDSKIMNGYFIAPQYVIDVSTQQSWGNLPKFHNIPAKSSLNKLVSTINDSNWIERAEIPLREMQNDATKQKVVLGMQQTLNLQHPLYVANLITTLIKEQPNSYHFVLKDYDELFVSATPERLIKLQQNQIATAAVAGTINRSSNEATDQALARELQHDNKNLYEHELVVQEITTKIAHLADLSYPPTPEILKTPQVQHLYTPITGTLNQNESILNLVNALHPTPALGGIPLSWALNQIKQTEIKPRGLFAAPIGYLLPNGDGEFVIGIRSLWQTGNTIHLFAGAGILAASNLPNEAHEINLKMSVMKDIIKEQINERTTNQ
ncbi:isochorismate synthase [Fructilactobacillus sp. Tb1]|uniref:isochorismate synthase n=1 Tax=Fructilactobacillus sp. Tb1 TaxID=3422304 RepID=UPI003D2D2854